MLFSCIGVKRYSIVSALGGARVTCGNEFRGVALTTLEVPQIPAATLRCSLALWSARGSPPPFPQTLCSHHALKLQAPKLRQGHILGVLRVRGTIWRVVPSVLLRAIGCLDVVVVCHRNRPDASRVPVAAVALTVGVSPHLRDVNWDVDTNVYARIHAGMPKKLSSIARMRDRARNPPQGAGGMGRSTTPLGLRVRLKDHTQSWCTI